LNDLRVITLGGKRGGVTIVDAADFKELNRFKWTQHKRGYVVRKAVRMHRKILIAPDGIEVDHRNHCLNDNTRRNLRLVTHLQNGYNQSKRRTVTSSRFKGIHWGKQHGKWFARISVNGSRKFIGLFADEVQAAIAYNKAARKHHGEFASLNPVDG